jgi:hypothetical protein
MELPPDPHRVIPIKRLTTLLIAASHRADFSYLLRGCLPVELRGCAVVGSQQLPVDVEAVWILLHSIEFVVTPIGGSFLKAEENDLRQQVSTFQPDMCQRPVHGCHLEVAVLGDVHDAHVCISEYVFIEWLVRKTDLNEGPTVHGEIIIKQKAVLPSPQGLVRIG